MKKPVQIKLPGQQRFKTIKEAFRHITETLDRLHVQTHDNLKRKGRH